MLALEIALILLAPFAALVVTAIAQQAKRNSAEAAEAEHGPKIAVLPIASPRSWYGRWYRGLDRVMAAGSVCMGLVAIPLGFTIPGWLGIGVTFFGVWCLLEPWFLAQLQAASKPEVVLYESGLSYPVLMFTGRHVAWSAISSIDSRHGKLVLVTRDERIGVDGLDADSRQRVVDEWGRRGPS